MNFDERTEKLLSHVTQNHADESINILSSGNFDHSILTDVGCFGNPLPLYKITLCNELIFSNTEWHKDFIPTIKEYQAECKKLKTFWHDRYGYDTDTEMDFEPYPECAHYMYDEYDLTIGNLENLLKLGYDRDEVELCHATLVYNYRLLKKHITRRTNPDVWINEDNYPKDAIYLKSDSYNAYEQSATIYWDCFDCYDLLTFYQDNILKSINKYDLQLVFEAAAYIQLYYKFSEIVKSNTHINKENHILIH